MCARMELCSELKGGKVEHAGPDRLGAFAKAVQHECNWGVPERDMVVQVSVAGCARRSRGRV